MSLSNVTSPATELINNVYSGTTEFGKLWAIITVVVSLFASICLIYLGSYLMKDHLSANTTGIAIASDVPDCYTNNGVKTCRTKVSYTVDNIQYMSTLDSSYSAGEKITIYYNPKDPTKISAYSYYKAGIFCIVISIFSMLVFGMKFYAEYNTKFGAAASGIGGAMDIIR